VIGACEVERIAGCRKRVIRNPSRVVNWSGAFDRLSRGIRMPFDLTPLVGPLPLRFGMNRAEVDAVVAAMPIPSAYAGSDVRRSDAIGVYPRYDAGGRLDFVDLSSRCYIRYGGNDILDMTAEETVELFVRAFGPYQTEGASYVFAGPCFMLFVEGDEVRAVAAFTREYHRRRFRGGG
jgi:hypothetical protein